MKNSIYSFLISFIGFSAFANVSLPAFFSDNMVLQRNADVKLWGWGSPNEEITITTGWDEGIYKVKPGNQATWQIIFKTPKEGGPYTLRFKGYNEVVFNNVMLGEVWLCSGQSNMEWTPASGIDNAEVEIGKANYPNIRFFTVPKLTATFPQDNLTGNWQLCTPNAMRYFSAIGYFFAQQLQEDLKDVPIGIINSSWGGTPAEIWMPADYVAKNEVIATAASKLTPAQWGPIEPGRAYNAMIHPFTGFKIAGVLWYQGESNVGSNVYNTTLGGLITSWREAWQDNFPFYFVQIAPFKYGGDNTSGVKIRDAQRKVANDVPNTGMVVISDVSTVDDIHPRNKKPVGIRLANLALHKTYKQDKSSLLNPSIKNVKVNGNKATVYFNSAQGLRFKGAPSTLFEIAGIDGTFYPATAKIIKGAITITAKEIKNPKVIRFAWHDTDLADVVNDSGLPASSFLIEIK